MCKRNKIHAVPIILFLFLAMLSLANFVLVRYEHKQQKREPEIVNKVISIEEAVDLINKVENKEYINIYDIKGWECWEENGKVFLEIGDWEISKEAYTLDASYRKIED